MARGALSPGIGEAGRCVGARIRLGRLPSRNDGHKQTYGRATDGQRVARQAPTGRAWLRKPVAAPVGLGVVEPMPPPLLHTPGGTVTTASRRRASERVRPELLTFLRAAVAAGACGEATGQSRLLVRPGQILLHSFKRESIGGPTPPPPTVQRTCLPLLAWTCPLA